MKFLLFVLLHLVTYTSKYTESNIPTVKNETGKPGVFGQSINQYDYYGPVGLNNSLATVNNKFLSPSHFWTITKNDNIQSFDKEDITPYTNLKNSIDNSNILTINSDNTLLKKVENILKEISLKGSATLLEENECIHFYSINDKHFTIIKLILYYDDSNYEEAIKLISELNHCTIKINKAQKIVVDERNDQTAQKDAKIKKDKGNKKAETSENIKEDEKKLTSSFHYRYHDSFYQDDKWKDMKGIKIELGEIFLSQNSNEISFNFKRLTKNNLKNDRYHEYWWKDDFVNLNYCEPDSTYSNKQTHINNLRTLFHKKKDKKKINALPIDKPFQDNTLNIIDNKEGKIDIPYRCKYTFSFNQKEVWKISEYDVRGIKFIYDWWFWQYKNAYIDKDGPTGVWDRLKKNLNGFFDEMNNENFIFLQIPNVLLINTKSSEGKDNHDYWYKRINFNRYLFFDGIDFDKNQKRPKDHKPGIAATIYPDNKSDFDQNEIFKLEKYISKDKDKKIFPSIVLKDDISNQIYVEDISYLKDLPEYIETLEYNNVQYTYSVKIQNMEITDKFVTNIELIYSLIYFDDDNKKIDMTKSITYPENSSAKSYIESQIKNNIQKNIEQNITLYFTKQKGKNLQIHNTPFESDILTFSILSKYEYYENCEINLEPRSEYKNIVNRNINKEIARLLEEDGNYSEYIKKVDREKENIAVTNINIVADGNLSTYKVTLPLSYQDFKDIYDPLRSDKWNIDKLSNIFNIYYKIMKNREEFRIDNEEKTLGVIFKYGSIKILNQLKKICNESIIIEASVSKESILLENNFNFDRDISVIIELVPFYREIPKISNEEAISFNGPTPFYNSKDKRYELAYNVIKKSIEKDDSGNIIQENIKFFDVNKDTLQTSTNISPTEEDINIINSTFTDEIQKDFYNNVQIYRYNNTKCFVFTPKENLKEDNFELKCFNRGKELEKDGILELNCNDKRSLLKFELELIDDNNIFGDIKKSQLTLKDSTTKFISGKEKGSEEYINAIYPLLIDQLEYNSDDMDNTNVEHRDTNILHYKKDNKHCLILELSKLNIGLQNFESTGSEDEYIDWVLEFNASTHVGKTVTLQFPIKLKLIRDDETNIEKKEEEREEIFKEYTKSKEKSFKKNLSSSFYHINFNISTKILEERSANNRESVIPDESENISNFYSYSSYDMSKNCGDKIEVPSNAFDISENSIKIQFCSDNIYYDSSINRDNVFVSVYNSKKDIYINECEIRQIIGSESGKNFIEIPLSKIKNLFNEDIEDFVKLRIIIFPTARIRGTNQSIKNSYREFSKSGLKDSFESYEMKNVLDDSYIKAKEPIFIECDIVKGEKIDIEDIQEEFDIEKDYTYDSINSNNIGIANFNLSFSGFKESDNVNGIYSHILLIPDICNMESVKELKYSMNMNGLVSQYSRAELDRIFDNRAIFELSRKHSINSNMNLKKAIVSRNGFVVEIEREKELKNSSLEEIKIRDISFFDNKLKIDIDSRVMPISCKVKCDKDIMEQSAAVENDRHYDIYLTTFIFEDIDLENCKEIELSSDKSEYIKEYKVNIEDLDSIEKYRGKLHRLSVDSPLMDDLIEPSRYRYKNLLYKGILKVNGNRDITTNSSIANLEIDVNSINVSFAKPFIKDGIEEDVSSFHAQKINISKINTEEKDMSKSDWDKEKDKSYRNDRVVIDTYMDKDDLLVVSKNREKEDRIYSPKDIYELEITRKIGTIQENTNTKLERDKLFDRQFGEEDLFIIDEEDNFDINSTYISDEEVESIDIESNILNSKILDFNNKKVKDGSKVITNPQVDGKYFVINNINSHSTLTDIQKGHIKQSEVFFYKKDTEAKIEINYPVYPIDASFLDKYLKYINKDINSLNLDDYIFYLKSQLISNCDTETLVASMMRSARDKLNIEIAAIGSDMIKERDKFVKDRLSSIAQRIDSIKSQRFWIKSFFSIFNTAYSCAFSLIPVAGPFLSQVMSNVVSLIELNATGDASFGLTMQNSAGLDYYLPSVMGLGFKADTYSGLSLNASAGYSNCNFNWDYSSGASFGMQYGNKKHNLGINSSSGISYSYAFQNNVSASLGYSLDDAFGFGLGYSKGSYKGNMNINTNFKNKFKIGMDGEYFKAITSNQSFLLGGKTSWSVLSSDKNQHIFDIGLNSSFSDNLTYSDRVRKAKAEFTFARNVTKGYNNLNGSIFLNNKKVFSLDALRDLESGEPLPPISDQLSLSNLEPLISGAIEETGLSIYEYMKEEEFKGNFIKTLKEIERQDVDIELKEQLNNVPKDSIKEIKAIKNKFVEENVANKLTKFIENEIDNGILFNQKKYKTSSSKVEAIVNKFNNSKELSVLLEKIYNYSDKTKKQISEAARLFKNSEKESNDGITTTNSKEGMEAIDAAHKVCHQLTLTIKNKKVTLSAMPVELIGINLESHEKAIYRDGDKIVLVKYNRGENETKIVKLEIDSKDENGMERQIDKLNFDSFKDSAGNDILVLTNLNSVKEKQIGNREGKNKLSSNIKIATSDVQVISKERSIRAIDNIITNANIETKLNGNKKEVIYMDYLKVISQSFESIVDSTEYEHLTLYEKITLAANSIKKSIKESTDKIVNSLKEQFNRVVVSITEDTNISRVESDFNEFIDTIKESSEKELQNVDAIIKNNIENKQFDNVVENINSELGQNIEGYNTSKDENIANGVMRKFVMDIDSNKEVGAELEEALEKLSNNSQSILTKLINDKEITSTKLKELLSEIINDTTMDVKDKSTLIKGTLISVYKNKIDSYLDRTFVDFYRENRENILSGSEDDNLLKINSILSLDRSISMRKNNSFEEFIEKVNKNIEKNIIVRGSHESESSIINKINKSFKGSSFIPNKSGKSFKLNIKAKNNDIIDELNSELKDCNNKEEAVTKLTTFIFNNVNSFRSLYDMKKLSSNTSSAVMAGELAKKLLDKDPIEKYNFICNNEYCRDEPRRIITENIHMFIGDTKDKNNPKNNDTTSEEFKILNWGKNNGERVENTKNKQKQIDSPLFWTTPTNFETSTLSNKTMWIFKSHILIPKRSDL